MEDSNRLLLKSTMNNGAILGLALIIFTLLLWMLDATTNRNLSFISYGIIIAGLYLAIKSFRDQEQGGYITYGRALGAGTLTSVFAGIITSFFTFLLYTLIDPGLIDKTYLIMEQAYYDAGMSDNQIEAAMSIAKRFTNPVMMMVLGFLGSVLMGFIFSLILSIFLKKEADPFQTKTD